LPMNFFSFFLLPRCTECSRGIAVRKAVSLSVCLSNACIVTKRKKDLSKFLYHTKDQYKPIFLRRRMAGVATPSSLRRSSYVAPKPPWGLKMQNGRFSSKIALRLKKGCYKVSLCENCQRQSL